LPTSFAGNGYFCRNLNKYTIPITIIINDVIKYAYPPLEIIPVFAIIISESIKDAVIKTAYRYILSKFKKNAIKIQMINIIALTTTAPMVALGNRLFLAKTVISRKIMIEVVMTVYRIYLFLLRSLLNFTNPILGIVMYFFAATWSNTGTKYRGYK